MEKLILTFVMGIVLIMVTSAVVYDLAEEKHCNEKKGYYSRGVCFKRDAIQE